MLHARACAAAVLAALGLAGCGAIEPDSALDDRTEARWVQPATAGPSAKEPTAQKPNRNKIPKSCKDPGPGDINGDGHADAVVAERLGESEPGGIRVLYGTPSGLTATGAEGGLDDQELTQDSPAVPGVPTKDGYDQWAAALAVGDFDGDGCADVAVGAPGKPAVSAVPADGDHGNVGQVTVLYGTPSGLSGARAQTLRQSGAARGDRDTLALPGIQEPGDGLGSALTAGDFDGDGHADLAVAAAGDAPGPNNIVLPGPPIPDVPCPADASCLPPGPRTGPAPDRGAVTVVYGSASGLGRGVRPPRSFSHLGLGGSPKDHYDFGRTVAAGDFDGDGNDDLAVSATPGDVPGTTAFGLVYVLPGVKRTGLGTRPPQRFDRATEGIPGNGADEGFGSTLATGDLDGDGSADLALAAGEGVIVLYSVGADGLSGDGAQEWTGDGDFGSSLAIGQLGGPGRSLDLAIGAPYDDVRGKQIGSVTVLFGRSGRLGDGDALVLTQAGRGEPGDRFGEAVATVAIRGKRFDDLLVGAPGAGKNATPSDSAGALDEFPSGPDGPSQDQARRWLPNSPGMAGTPIRGGAMGHTLG